MKVLIATTYIYKKEWPEFTKNRTGFGIMVNDIFESVSEENDTYLISQVITEGHGKVLRHTWREVFENAVLKDWGKGFKYFLRYRQGIKGRIKYFYYALNSGTVRKVIRTIKPDIVHIQGIGVQIKPFIDVCKEERVPYVITLHGLIGLDDTVLATRWDKELEKSLLIEADQKGIPVTVISSGMKRRIEINYLHHTASNITVICNGINISGNNDISIDGENLDLRKEFNLSTEKIVVVVGSICERKNQIQIVRALSTGIVNSQCHVFMCGVDVTNGEVQKAVELFKLNNVIHFLGFLPRNKIIQIFKQADLNVVASRDEGFGLSIIEGLSCGVPSVAFSDLDAIADLYNDQVMIKVEKRTDDALERKNEKGLSTTWNKQRIIEYSMRFSLKNMAELYCDEYSKIVNIR